MALGVLLLAAVPAACRAVPILHMDRPIPHATRSTPIGRGLEFLENTQVTREDERNAVAILEGGWPMSIRIPLGLDHLNVEEIGSGMAAYVHLALGIIRDENADALGLTPDDLARARRMRSQAIGFMERFRVTGPGPTVYGWWPPRTESPRGLTKVFSRAVARWARGPLFHGDLMPPGLRGLPADLCPTPDLDDTALVLLSRLAHAELDGGPHAPETVAARFTPWRDTPEADRTSPTWLEPESGAFLLWMMAPRADRVANEVDLGGLANVLYALARYGELDTPGAAASIDVILRTTREGHHLQKKDLSIWTPRMTFYFTAARAYACGPVPALAPAVEILAADLVASARHLEDGSATWGRPGREEEAYGTASAVLTLLHAKRAPALARAGCRRLLALQDRRTGGWRAGTLWWSTAGNGVPSTWHAAAPATALAIEALARTRLVTRDATRRPSTGD